MEHPGQTHEGILPLSPPLKTSSAEKVQREFRYHCNFNHLGVFTPRWWKITFKKSIPKMFQFGWQFFFIHASTLWTPFWYFKILTIQGRPNLKLLAPSSCIYTRRVHIYRLFFTSVHTERLYNLSFNLMFPIVNILHLTISLFPNDLVLIFYYYKQSF